MKEHEYILTKNPIPLYVESIDTNNNTAVIMRPVITFAYIPVKDNDDNLLTKKLVLIQGKKTIDSEYIEFLDGCQRITKEEYEQIVGSWLKDIGYIAW